MKKVFNLENLLVVIILFSGILISLLVLPNQVPDEDSHFARVYAILDGKFTQNHVELPKSLIAKFDEYRAAYPSSKHKLMFDVYLSDFKTDRGDTRTSTHNAANYTPVLYLPHILGLGLGEVLKMAEIEKFMTGRLFSVLFYSVIGYFILKKASFAKGSLFVLLAMPMSVGLAASYSADGMQIILSFLYISLLVSELHSQDPLSTSKKITLILLGALLGLTKPVSLVLILLACAIPLERFKNKINRLVFLLLHLGLGILPAFLWIKITASNLVNEQTQSWGVSPAGQLMFILQNPFRYLGIVLESLALNREFLVKSFIGKFGWLTIELPWFAYFLFALLLCLALFGDSSKLFRLNQTQKFIFFAVVFLYFMAVMTSMYLFWTPVGSELVQGVQGRYFIPVFPVLLYFMLSFLHVKEVSWHWLVKGSIGVLVSALLAISLQTIYQQFFAPCGNQTYLNSSACQRPAGLQAEKTVGELGKPFTQTFTPECDQMSGIAILLVSSPGEKQGPLDLELLDLSSNTLIFQGQVFAGKIKGEKWKAIDFPPVQKSSADRFSLTIKNADKIINSASLGITATDVYPQGELSGVDFPADLVFRYACKPGIAEQLLSGRE